MTASPNLNRAAEVEEFDETENPQTQVNEADLMLNIRRLTSGKGRTAIEITGLPNNKKWCKNLARALKKKIGVGGSYKENFIELHGEKLAELTRFLDEKSIKWKKTGG